MKSIFWRLYNTLFIMNKCSAINSYNFKYIFIKIQRYYKNKQENFKHIFWMKVPIIQQKMLNYLEWLFVVYIFCLWPRFRDLNPPQISWLWLRNLIPDTEKQGQVQYQKLYYMNFLSLPIPHNLNINISTLS